MASRLFVVLLMSTMVLCALADDVRNIHNARKLLGVNAADAISRANAIATAYMNGYNQGATRPPTVAECEAAASASTDVLSSGGGGTAFAAAQAQAQASGESWGTPGWKATFTSACKASASASSRTWTNSDGTVHTESSSSASSSSSSTTTTTYGK